MFAGQCPIRPARPRFRRKHRFFATYRDRLPSMRPFPAQGPLFPRGKRPVHFRLAVARSLRYLHG
jgi:hypothetical protein